MTNVQYNVQYNVNAPNNSIQIIENSDVDYAAGCCDTHGGKVIVLSVIWLCRNTT